MTNAGWPTRPVDQKTDQEESPRAPEDDPCNARNRDRSQNANRRQDPEHQSPYIAAICLARDDGLDVAIVKPLVVLAVARGMNSEQVILTQPKPGNSDHASAQSRQAAILLFCFGHTVLSSRQIID